MDRFLLAPSLSRDGFRPKRNPDSESGFSENPQKSILAGNYKTFLQKSSNFHVEDRRNNSAKRLYKFCSVFYLFYLSLSTIDSTYLCIKDVSIGHVDCTADDNLNRALCDGQGVNGFPTLNIYKSGILSMTIYIYNCLIS